MYAIRSYYELDSVLCPRHERSVSSDYTLGLHGRVWAISRAEVLPGLREVRAGIRHGGIEPNPVEIVSYVVMVPGVAARADGRHDPSLPAAW